MYEHHLIAQSFKERYKRTLPVNRHHIIAGCSDIEIREIEDRYNVKLPKSYYFFLKELGKTDSALLGNLDLEYPHPLTQTEEFIDNLLSEDEEEVWIPPTNIPTKIFIFANYYFQKVFFFIADSSSDDPPIFSADSSQESGEAFKYRKTGESIWEFVEDCLKTRE